MPSIKNHSTVATLHMHHFGFILSPSPSASARKHPFDGSHPEQLHTMSTPSLPSPSPPSPEVYYTCRKCSHTLFSRSDVLHEGTPGHTADGIGVSSAKAGWIHNRPTYCGVGGTCSSVFMRDAPPWVTNVHANHGRILCPRCNAKLGSFAWSGAPCSCGKWVTPAFQFQLSRIDPRGIVQLPVAAAGKGENGVGAA